MKFSAALRTGIMFTLLCSCAHAADEPRGKWYARRVVSAKIRLDDSLVEFLKQFPGAVSFMVGGGDADYVTFDTSLSWKPNTNNVRRQDGWGIYGKRITFTDGQVSQVVKTLVLQKNALDPGVSALKGMYTRIYGLPTTKESRNHWVWNLPNHGLLVQYIRHSDKSLFASIYTTRMVTSTGNRDAKKVQHVNVIKSVTRVRN